MLKMSKKSKILGNMTKKSNSTKKNKNKTKSLPNKKTGKNKNQNRRTKSSKNTKKTQRHRSKKNIRKLWDNFNDEFENDIPCIFKKSVKNILFDEEKVKALNTDIEGKKICDICNFNLLITDHNHLTCSNPKCSKLYTKVLDDGAEWRYYGAEDNSRSDPTRCGMPINPLLKESSFGCTIKCNYRSTYEMKKIRRYTDWQSMPYKEKSQYDEFQKIKAMAEENGISKFIVDDALIFHKTISENKTFRGCNRQGIIAASIYIACRKNNVPRTPKEIANIFNLNTTAATKGCKNALHIMNDIDKDNNDNTHFYRTTPSSFIERYCSKLNLNNELTELCKFIAHIIEKKNIMPENTPHSVAGGIIYFVAQNCKLNVTKKNIFNVSQISEVTINKCFKKLDTIRTKLIPKKVLKKYNY